MSKTETALRPSFDACLGFTKSELRGIKRLADRIRFDLYVAPANTAESRIWRTEQQIALAVIEGRIKHGR